MKSIDRVTATDKAKKLLSELKNMYGELMLYQSGGCCEGTQPQCFKKGDFYLRYKDVCIGEIDHIEFWVDKDLFDYWKYAHFELDVTDAIGTSSFSLETPLGKTFKINYNIFTQEELSKLKDVKINK